MDRESEDGGKLFGMEARLDDEVIRRMADGWN